MGMENLISLELRAGVLLSITLIAIGVALIFVNGTSNGYALSEIAATNSTINSAGFGALSVIYSIGNFQGIDFIFLGLIVLLLTPIVRVVLSILFFMEEKNWLYVVITLIVLFNLLFAIFVVPSLVGTKVVIPQ